MANRTAPPPRRAGALAALALLALGGSPAAIAAAEAPLAVVAAIPLGDVAGRIDHLAVDLARSRLFVAELGNDSVGVVDIAGGAMQRTLPGIDEPQGIGYFAAADIVAVASGGDGLLHLLAGDDLRPLATVPVGRDADNVRVHPDGKRLLVGYADGLAVVDPIVETVTADIPLPAHAEGFQITPDGRSVLVNLPEAHSIATVRLDPAALADARDTGAAAGNFPIALAGDGGAAFAAFRRPPLLAAYSLPDGREVASAPACGDADDVFADDRRDRVYVVCGEGAVAVFARRGEGLEEIARIDTAPRARTGLFVPELDTLFVAAPAADGAPARILVLRPTD